KRSFDLFCEDEQRFKAERAIYDKIEFRINEAKKRLVECEERRSAICMRLKDYFELDQIKREEEKLKEDLAEVEEKISCESKRVQDETIALKEQISQWRTEANELGRQIKALTDRLNAFSEISDQQSCPTCWQPLNGHELNCLKQRFEAERADLKEQEGQLKNRVSKAENETLKQIKSSCNLEAIASSRNTIKSKLEELRKTSTDLALLEQVKLDQESVAQSITLLVAELDQSQQKLKLIPFDQSRFLKGRARFETAKSLVDVLRMKVVRAQAERDKAKLSLERSRAQLSEIEKKQVQVNEMRKHLVSLTEADQILTEFRKYLNDNVRPQLAEFAGQFLSELTDGRYSAVEIGKDFVPTVIEDGEPKPVISGGEEEILNLCLRLALSQMLAERAGERFSLLVLDGVFGSLDETRRFNVIHLLERLRARFEQIVVITHIEEVKDALEHLITLEFNDSTGNLIVGGSRAEDAGLVENF
ncbi:MAG: hypothetical protein KDD53_09465, partial [Bdellovibrionales bacterium]|nr:hypothetical protein [Bdellovibrionales bacterium]